MAWSYITRVVIEGEVLSINHRTRQATIYASSGWILGFEDFIQTPYEDQPIWLEITPSNGDMKFKVWPYNPDGPKEATEGWQENGF